jgi:predicted transcriptional regulator/two-component sensor histidine kinase
MEIERRELRVSLDRAKSPVALEMLDSGRPQSRTFRIANISRNGMFIEASQDVPIEQGSELHFALRLDRDEEVTGVAKVRWVRGADLGPYLPKGAGVQVLEFHENAEKRYLEFLESCLLDLKITDLMDPTFASLAPTDEVERAVALFRDRKADCIVITDTQGKPLGTFTKNELCTVLHKDDFLSELVGSCMRANLVTLSTDHDTEDAYRIMRQGGLSHIVVVEDGLAVGLLSTKDLVRYWAEFMDLQAKRLTRNYDRAMSVIAHDLRTPIGLIQSTNQMLIDDILDVGRIKAGAVRLDCQAVDLSEVLRKSARAFGPTANAKDIDVKVTIQGAIPRIKADPLRLEQILNNLISNALKFSPEGGRVAIGAKTLHSKVAIWVTDQGPGIPAAELDGLFKEFSVLSSRPTKGEKSTGLGLAITKRLVEAHGGRITVESTPGLGTTFTVYLPISEIQ